MAGVRVCRPREHYWSGAFHKIFIQHSAYLKKLPERQVKAKCTYATTSLQDNLELRNPIIRSKQVKSCHQAIYH